MAARGDRGPRLALATVMVATSDFVIQINLPQSDTRLSGVLLLLGFLVSFGFIRMSTRLMRSPRVPWWPGSIKTEGGLHIHHLVFGIVLMMLVGFLAFTLQPDDPWVEVLAVAFGVGVGLTLDEYALWLHLEDVYWAEEGRQSVDAVIIATLIGGTLVLGFTPIDSEDTGSVLAVVGVLAIVLVIALLAALKGKYTAAVIGVLLPVVSLVAAIRLAKPGSPWARRRYAESGEKMARAVARDERSRARRRRWQNRIGGAPTPVEPPEQA